MIGKSTEKAIKAWLALPKEQREITVSQSRETISLWEHPPRDSPNYTGIIAKFSIRSIVAKRYPKRKKVKK